MLQEEILYEEINLNKKSPLVGSSYIKAPKFVENKKVIVNINNREECCFAWTIILALYPPKDPLHEMSSYPYFSSVLNLVGINFPVKFKDISKFESMNLLTYTV